MMTNAFEQDLGVAHFENAPPVACRGMTIGVFFMRRALNLEAIEGHSIANHWLVTLKDTDLGLAFKTVEASMLFCDEVNRFCSNFEALTKVQTEQDFIRTVGPNLVSWIEYIQENDHLGRKCLGYREWLCQRHTE